MKIEKAKELGFCFGVRRAITILEKAALKYGKIATVGPIVHNPRVVEMLAEKKVTVVNSLSEVKAGTLAVATHGVGPEVLAEIKARQLSLIDTTCPIVHSAQKVVQKLSGAGFWVVIFGDAAHPEVKGLLKWAKNKAIATLKANEVFEIKNMPQRLGILSQTTQSQPNFYGFVKEILSVALPSVREVRIVNTICAATQKRQEEALELARRSELMIVVGGRNSANTQRLVEVCSSLVETHLVESASEINKDWLSGKSHVGITAGASTPDQAIDEVVSRLKSLSKSTT